MEWKDLTLTRVYGAAPYSMETLETWLAEYADRIKPFVCDTSAFLRQAQKDDKNILFEAQLGALRDLDFGIYPYTTSSNTTAAYAPIGSGLPSLRLTDVVGVVKAYSTCVGEGPFVCEMFGAEAAFFSRCVDAQVFERAVALVSGFRRYYVERGQPVYENPSPGNKTGGISTLEEKSLGCVQKGGGAPITDVIAYGDRAARPGLSLLQGPGNDQVSTTALVAAGATLVLFTTGRGTPLGSPVPTLKVSTNSDLFGRKPGWIDFDAGVIASGAERETVDSAFCTLVFEVANGKPTRNEEHGQRDIAIFKDGVTL
jgi:altronate hydrolase